MLIKQEKSYGIVGTSILDINYKEMTQMCDLKKRIAHVLDTHKDENSKNEYLTDDELEKIYVILYVFTKNFSSNNESAFDKALEELKKLVEQPKPALNENTTFG